jgi:NAD-dependent deacetylase
MLGVKHAADLVEHAQQVVVFTGAGVSTESGIPDFRSPHCGLWDDQDPMIVASMTGFRQNPTAFFDWVRPLTQSLMDAIPNPAHNALAALEVAGKVSAIITQNIDGLHQYAGSRTVHEVHGNLRTATCTHCFKTYDTADILHDHLTEQIPLCDCQAYGSVIKPDVILFGEQLPYHTVQLARKALTSADLLIVAGSSLSVEPASRIPGFAVQQGTKLIIINYEPTSADGFADVVINDNVSEILPAIVNELGILHE